MESTEERVNILLVDDQPNNLLALESMLGDMGQNLVRAESGTRALKQLLDREFAVILLDVQMPDLDGFETATLVRQRERSRDTPIIFLTALSRSETNVFRGYELGAVDYIFKPLNADILRSKVNVFVQLFRQREKLKRQAQELARVIKQNELILSAAAEGVLGIDLEGVATFVNPAAARMFGRFTDDVIAHDVHSLAHPAYPGVATCEIDTCALYAVLHGDFAREQTDATFFRNDGTSFPVEFSSSPMRDADGTLLGAVVTFRDITERRAAAATEEAERRYREAESQNRAKDNFLATLSHELRTPMTSILGWVQFLRIGGYSQEELDEALETIETSARLQARLIDDMLDVSRIILGKFQIDLRPTNLSDVVEAALTTVRPAAQECEITLTSSIETEDDDLVEADPNRMQQVIGNILSNAIKFTPSGKQVDLIVDRIDSKVRIIVADQGEGIDPSFLPHVFERLRQAEGATKRSGLGLGLAIARHIVELHHGEISAESEGLGKGARFIITLPLAHSGGQALLPVPGQAGVPALH
jgi:PAS domain S-box-containing protein